MRLPRHDILPLPLSYWSEQNTIFEPGGEGLQRWSSIIGISTAIAGNILISFALNIQRLAHIKVHEQNMEQLLHTGSLQDMGTSKTMGNVRNIAQSGDGYDSLGRSLPPQGYPTQLDQSEQNNYPYKTYLGSPYWWIGIFLMTVGEAGNFLAYGFAPASIVSPLGVVSLISNCVVAPVLLKEKFRFRDFWGVIVAITGAVTVVMSAKQKEQKLGPHEIIEAISRTEFQIYMAITISLIIALAWASPKFGGSTIMIDLGLVGLLGGYTALSTKGVSSMLSSTLWRTLTTPVTYGLLLVLVFTAVMQVRYLSRALQRFDSTQVIPVQFVTFTLSVIIGSAILYRDLENITLRNALKLAGGCILAFLGVWLITSGRLSSKEYNDSRNKSDERLLEEQINMPYVDETLGPISDNIISGRLVDHEEAPNTIRVRTSSQSDIAGQQQQMHPSSRIFIKNTKILEVPDIHSEDSPLLDKNRGRSSEQSPQRVFSTNQKLNSAPIQNTETTGPNFNSTNTNESIWPSALAHFQTIPTLTQPSTPQTDQSSLSKIERPVTPTCHPMSRLINGPLISPLSGGLSGATADSLRRGANSTIHNRYQKLHHHSGLYLTRIEYAPCLGVSGDEPEVIEGQKESTAKKDDDCQKQLISVASLNCN